MSNQYNDEIMERIADEVYSMSRIDKIDYLACVRRGRVRRDWALVVLFFYCQSDEKSGLALLDLSS